MYRQCTSRGCHFGLTMSKLFSCFLSAPMSAFCTSWPKVCAAWLFKAHFGQKHLNLGVTFHQHFSLQNDCLICEFYPCDFFEVPFQKTISTIQFSYQNWMKMAVLASYFTIYSFPLFLLLPQFLIEGYFEAFRRVNAKFDN